WDGGNGALLRTFTAFSAAQSDGVFVAAGDINGDGRKEIIAGTDSGGAGLVRLFDGQGQALGGLTMKGDGEGGVRVAAGDLDGDGRDDLVTATGPGAGRVRLFDGTDNGSLGTLTPFGASFTAGLFVAADAPASGGGALGPLSGPEVTIVASVPDTA